MYCGRTPQKHNITLEVDHRISVKSGGGNEEENLTTSCYDCNRGKRADSIIVGDDLEKTKNELEEIKERLEQIKYISKLKKTIKKKKDDIEKSEYSFVRDILDGYSDEFIRKVEVRIKNQHIRYGIDYDIMEESLIITHDKFSTEDEFYHDRFMMYFHGVLNNKLS